ncbi:hypothetical protein CCAX7_56620 [Capsulimonas corticalis]|uniref:Uncharacterized protein n=1 Tax=Capsulimonas corticalis TaxID=2219043 RepID=A0A402D0L6_9BACT|nr:hypothetical protein [Capsulimonas corticalis]BDI33611.1 hypothetical protein CCAX7_56620 [Capsulimonas corticalis]
MSPFSKTPRQSTILGAALGVGALILTGCGGGGGGSDSGSNPNGPTPAKQIQQGQSDINSIVRNSSSSNTQTVLQDAVTNFNLARKSLPSNNDAQAGFAISQAALAAIQFSKTLGVTSFALKANAAGPQSRLTRMAQASNALAIWNFPAFLSGSDKLPLPTASDLIPHVMVPHDSLTPVQIQASLVSLDTSLAAAESALSGPLANPSYVYIIADPSHTDSSTATVKVGNAELRTLAALIAVLRSVTNVTTAYSADEGTFNFGADVHTLSPFTLNSTVSPTTFLPGGTFAKLNTDGKTRMATVKTELQATITDAVTAVQSIKTRDNTGYLLNPGTLVTTQQLTNFQTQAQSYQPYLTGVQSVTLNTTNNGVITLKINLNAWFTNPPADLKAFLPTMKVTQSSGGNATLVTTPLPDHTFGGLLPAGVPSNTFNGTIFVTPGETADKLDGDLLSL